MKLDFIQESESGRKAVASGVIFVLMQAIFLASIVSVGGDIEILESNPFTSILPIILVLVMGISQIFTIGFGIYTIFKERSLSVLKPLIVLTIISFILGTATQVYFPELS
jgi:hypothetical protein